MAGIRLPLDVSGIDGHVTSPYGPRKIKGVPGDFHHGIDLGGLSTGSPVYSIDDGYVETIDRVGTTSAGRFVTIAHEGYTTRYLHLDSVIVTPKQPILSGQMVGTLGSTGQSTGPHLHLELLIGGKRVDPEPYLRRTMLPPSIAEVVFRGITILTGKLSKGATWIEGRPIRDLAHDLGCEVEWHEGTRTVVLHTTSSKAIEQAISLLKTVL